MKDLPFLEQVAIMRTFLLVPYIVSLLASTPVASQEIPFPQGALEKIKSLVGQMKKTVDLYRFEDLRDQLALFGTGVEQDVISAFKKAGKKGRLGFIQVLGLTGGDKGRTFLHKILNQPRAWTTRSELAGLVTLTLRDPQSQPALTGLLGRVEKEKKWRHICALLTLASTLPNDSPLPPLTLLDQPVNTGKIETVATIIFLARKGSKRKLVEALKKCWPKEALTWEEALLIRSWALAVARRGLSSWQNRLLRWADSSGIMREDRKALALALGANGFPPNRIQERGLFNGPSVWNAYLVMASTSDCKSLVSPLLESRVVNIKADSPDLGPLAGAFARSMNGDRLLAKALSFKGNQGVKEILVLELAKRILTRGKDKLAQKAATKRWDSTNRAQDLLSAVIAQMGLIKNKVGNPGKMEGKALRGEIKNKKVLISEIDLLLKGKRATPMALLDEAEEALALQLLIGWSDFFRRKFPSLAPAPGKVEAPGGAPYNGSPAYEHIYSFLKALPLFR